MSLAEKVRAYLRFAQRTSEVEAIDNRAAARSGLRGHGPFQHFTAPRPEGRTRVPGRARRKRREARERARG